MNFPQPEQIELQVFARNELDGALNHAIELLKPTAVVKRAGIKVVRKDVGVYNVAICEAVPYGTTYEDWN